MTLECLLGSTAPFRKELHRLRPFPGNLYVADKVTKLLKGSGMVASHAHCSRVQDPYSLRCIPQVHGAVRDAIGYAETVLSIEMNSATDNPMVFADSGDVLSGGNFHGDHRRHLQQ